MPQLTDAVVADIARWEAPGGKPVLTAYPDPGSRDGKPWTIGLGSTRIFGRPVREGDTITVEQAMEQFRKDLAGSEAEVRRLVKVPLTDNQYGALVSFTYNLGAGNLQSSTLLRLLNAGDYESVPDQLARWKYNDGKVMPGLVNRRAAEAGLWARGAHVAGKDMPPAPVPTPKPILRPEVIAPVGAALSAIATALTQLGGLGAPIVWALAIALVAATGLGVWWGVRRVRAAT